ARIKRSRSYQVGSVGLCFRKSFHSTSAISAIPMGAPGWPELAFCTASMLRARMALARSFRDIVHSVDRCMFGGAQIVDVARVGGIGFLYGIHAEGANCVGELFTGHSSLRGKVKVWRREDLRVCAGRRRTDGCRPPVFPRPLDPDCAPSGIPLRSWVLVLAE